MSFWHHLNLMSGTEAPWIDASLPSIGSNESSWNGYTTRVVIDWASLVGESASELRLTMMGGTTDTIVSPHLYVQKQAGSGDVYDFLTTPVEPLFGGSSGFTSTNGSEEVSDGVSLTLGPSDLIVVSWHIQTGDVMRYSSGATGIDTYYKSGDDAATVNVSGYSSISGHIYGISKLEYR